MTEQIKFCPSCNAQALFRLGEWECPSCGYILPKEQPASSTTSPAPEPRDDGINRAKLLIPPEPPAGPRFAAYQLRSIREPTTEAPTLPAEKLLFITVWFFVTAGVSLISFVHLSGVATVLTSLPAAIGSALLSTLAVSVAVYYDNDCLRQCSMWFVALIVVTSLIGVGLSMFSGMLAQALPLFPAAIMLAWLYTILWRDRRSED